MINNKTSIYILSIAVFLVTAASIILPGAKIASIGFQAFSLGFQHGYDDNPAEYTIDNFTPIDLKFTPEPGTLIDSNDSILFADGRKLPIVIDTVSVFVPDSHIPSWSSWLSVVLMLLSFILLVILIVKFLKFLINILHDRIFTNRNALLLRHISMILIAIALSEAISGWSADYISSLQNFHLQGYFVGAYWVFPWTNLLLGTIGLLIAQIWRRGVMIEEENELTV